MTQALHLPQAHQRDSAGFGATVLEILSALATEQTLALHASTKAVLPRQNLTELRAIYARSSAD